MSLSLVLFVALLCLSNSHAAYEDARCKCLCIDQSGDHNKTKPTRQVFVKATSADKCTCKNMLGPEEESLCPYCECKYQVRNTTTIKVVVCLILVVISALTLYMIFLLLLEPLLSTRRPVAADTSTSSIGSTASTSDGLVSRKQTVLHRHLSNFISPFAIFKKKTPLMPAAPVSSGDHGYAGSETVGKVSPDVSTMVWGRSGWSAEQLLPDHTEDCAVGRPEVGGYLHHRLTSSFRDPTDTDNETIEQIGISPGGRLSQQPPSWPAAVAGPSSTPSGAAVSTVVNRVRDQQQRWKGNVEAQRTRVFSEHTLLN